VIVTGIITLTMLLLTPLGKRFMKRRSERQTSTALPACISPALKKPLEEKILQWFSYNKVRPVCHMELS
jgi:hypothetical protein